MAQFASTTTPLAGNANWTSPAKNRDRTAEVTGIVFSDQAGTLFIDQSGDGTNWDFTTSTALTAGTGIGFKINLYSAFYRVRYVNGASAQNTFRLFAYATDAGRQT